MVSVGEYPTQALVWFFQKPSVHPSVPTGHACALRSVAIEAAAAAMMTKSTARPSRVRPGSLELMIPPKSKGAGVEAPLLVSGFGRKAPYHPFEIDSPGAVRRARDRRDATRHAAHTGNADNCSKTSPWEGEYWLPLTGRGASRPTACPARPRHGADHRHGVPGDAGDLFVGLAVLCGTPASRTARLRV